MVVPVQGLEELKNGNAKTNVVKSLQHFTLEELFNHVFDPPIHSFHDHGARVTLTPLSAEACRIHGIDPDALITRGYETFRVAGQINEGIQRLRFDAYERRRHEWMKTAMEERARLTRKKLSEDGGRCISMDSESKSLTPSTVLDQQARVTSQLIETEERRLLKAKERQKKELLQLLKIEQALAERQREQRIKAEQEQALEQQMRLEKRKKDRFIAEERRYRLLRKKAEEDKKKEEINMVAKTRFQKEQEARMEMQKRTEESQKQAKIQQMERMQKLKEMREHNEMLEEKRRIEVQKNADLRQSREAERFEKLEAKRLADLKTIEMKRRIVSKRIEANKIAAQQRDEQKMLELVEKRQRAKELQDRLAAQLRRKHVEELRQKEALSRKREYQAKLSRCREETMIQQMVQKIEEEEELVEKQLQVKLKRQLFVRQERAVNEEIKKENVDRFKRIEEYKRQSVLRKIEENNKKTEEMLKKKSEISDHRRRAALQVKIQKDLLMEQIERSKRIGGRSIQKIISSLEANRPEHRKDEGSTNNSSMTMSIDLMTSQSPNHAWGKSDIGAKSLDEDGLKTDLVKHMDETEPISTDFGTFGNHQIFNDPNMEGENITNDASVRINLS